jgi:glycosyltransferase involved in cell wall biosynthesis
LALTYAKIKKVNWIHIEHGSDFVQLSSKIKTFFAKIYDYTFGFLIFNLSNQNISISEAVQKFVQKFNKRNSPIIYRGLNFEAIDKIRPNIAIKEKFKDKVMISFVGRLYKWKGVENSILAIKSLPEELKKKIVFLIIGDGEDFTHLEKITGSEKSILMLGKMTRENTIGILKISDIYLHSAYSGGGLSTSLLEAMYCSCAIIATPNEGANEIVENTKNGILIEKSDAKLIKKAIINLINNLEIRKNIGINAKLKILNHFTWEESITKYAEIFRK